MTTAYQAAMLRRRNAAARRDQLQQATIKTGIKWSPEQIRSLHSDLCRHLEKQRFERNGEVVIFDCTGPCCKDTVAT